MLNPIGMEHFKHRSQATGLNISCYIHYLKFNKPLAV
jgi:hypothetical protein